MSSLLHGALPQHEEVERKVDDTCRLYTDLAWLWPLWGNAAGEDEYTVFACVKTG